MTTVLSSLGKKKKKKEEEEEGEKKKKKREKPERRLKSVAFDCSYGLLRVVVVVVVVKLLVAELGSAQNNGADNIVQFIFYFRKQHFPPASENTCVLETIAVSFSFCVCVCVCVCVVKRLRCYFKGQGHG